MNESDLSQVIKAGELIMIETGEYSDHEVCNPVRAKMDFTKRSVVYAFLENWKPENSWEEKPRPEHFLPWLCANGIVEDVENVTRWNVGCYDEFQP